MNAYLSKNILTKKVMNYSDEKFADIQMLRYRLNGFEQLSLNQKQYVYCLAKATLCGRDITTDQFGRYNLKIRKLLEALYLIYKEQPEALGLQGLLQQGLSEQEQKLSEQELSQEQDQEQFEAMTVYLKRVWFSNGIHHHYGCDKFKPQFCESWFRSIIARSADKLASKLGVASGDEVMEWCAPLFPVIFDPEIMPKRVEKACGVDQVKGSACNYYEGLTQQEVEAYYAAKNDPSNPCPPSYGLNSKLVKTASGDIEEQVWKQGGMYGEAIDRIVYWLTKAMQFAENEKQQEVIGLLISYYRTGDLKTFDSYSIEWLKEHAGDIDFINGFIEVYGDPLGFKASWEGIVTYKDKEANERTHKICSNAQWFEDHSPVDPRFKKKEVRGVTANVVVAAMLGGDEYPSTAIGINLPNADWIRAQHGSKSITIGNLTEAYSRAAEGNGFLEEFVADESTLTLVRQFDHLCDDLHTDLHECLGHGSGQLLPGVSSDALKSYGSTIEEARADLFGLYYMADAKMVELGLLPSADAYKAHYYTYMLNGLMTQLRRITPGADIEEDHMRNRALIAYWVLDHAQGEVELTESNGKTCVFIHSYERLRTLFAQLLAEIQRIKSEGDYKAARQLVERYGVKVDQALLEEVHRRYEKLDIAPYKGFINPRLSLVTDAQGNVCDVKADYTESYEHQMLRYSNEFGFLSSKEEKSSSKEESSSKEDVLSSKSETSSKSEAVSSSVDDDVKKIKRSFRLFMNGVASSSMRDKGLEYKINWGIPVTRLRDMAAQYAPSVALAERLWESDVRECKILATMLMPAERFSEPMALSWLSACNNQEMVEMLVFNLVQNMPGVETFVVSLLHSDEHNAPLAALHLVSRLVARQNVAFMTDEVVSSFAQLVIKALNGTDAVLKHAALNSVTRYVDRELKGADKVVELLKKHKIDIF